MKIVESLEKGKYKEAALEAAPIVGYVILGCTIGILPTIAVGALINAKKVIAHINK